jgi:hypothetical protein
VLVAELFIGFLKTMTYLLILVFCLGVVPYAVMLVREELGIRAKAPAPGQAGHHRWGMENANNLAQVFLLERRYRETEHYKVTHHAIAGKRA